MTDEVTLHAATMLNGQNTGAPFAPKTLHAVNTFRPDIEGLRGIAVLLVVAFHAKFPGFSGGYVGVDVFFVLSGYLITSLLVREIAHTGTIDMAQFYARRARRLLPASALMALVTLIVSRFVFAPVEMETISRTARAVSVYLSNFWFFRNAADYFATSSESNPFLHTWSLAVEEQFYFVWPLLIMLAMRGRATNARLLLTLSIVTLLSMSAAVWFTASNRPLAFFGSPMRAWEFGIGGLASLVPVAVLQRHRMLVTNLGIAGLFSVFAAGFLYHEGSQFPGVAALLPVLGTTLALLPGGNSSDWLVGRLLGCRLLQWMGKLSYSWYLWHWPVLVWMNVMIPDVSLWARALAALASLGVAAVAYRLVENPVRFQPTLVARPFASILLALVLTMSGFGAARASTAIASRDASSPTQIAFTKAANDFVWVLREGGACDLTGITKTPRECVFGIPESSTTVVLTGDSHAAHWLPALEQVALSRRWRLVLMQQSACPTARVPVFLNTIQREFSECTAFREAVLRRVLEMRPQAVVLANATHAYVAGATARETTHLTTPERWTAGQHSTLAVLDSAGITSILLHDTPKIPFNVPICLARAAALGRDLDAFCRIRRDQVLDTVVFHAERDAVSELSYAHAIDLNDLLCNAESCPPVIGGKVVYRDDDHLTRTFSQRLAESLSVRIAPLVAAPKERPEGRSSSQFPIRPAGQNGVSFRADSL